MQLNEDGPGRFRLLQAVDLLRRDGDDQSIAVLTSGAVSRYADDLYLFGDRRACDVRHQVVAIEEDNLTRLLDVFEGNRSLRAVVLRECTVHLKCCLCIRAGPTSG